MYINACDYVYIYMHMYISIVTMFLFAYSHTVVLGREYYCNKFLSVCICLHVEAGHDM